MNTHEAVLNQVIWPVKPLLKDLDAWNQNCKVVELLCSLGSVTQWLDKEGYHLPYFYQIEGIEVQFLPNWGQYSVGGLSLATPLSKEAVFTAINAIKTLQRLGLKV